MTGVQTCALPILADPQKEIKGNRMPFSGLPEAAERDDVVAYLLQAAR